MIDSRTRANFRHQTKLARIVKARKRELKVYFAAMAGLTVFITLCVLGIVFGNPGNEIGASGVEVVSAIGLILLTPVALGTLGYQWHMNSPYERYERAKYELEDFMEETWV